MSADYDSKCCYRGCDDCETYHGKAKRKFDPSTDRWDGLAVLLLVALGMPAISAFIFWLIDRA